VNHSHELANPAVAIVALMIPIVIVPAALLMRYLARRREQMHVERLRAIELGYPLPESPFWPAFTALMIGAGVPLGACLLALATTLSMPDAEMAEPAWIVAGIIGGAGVLGGTVLASILFATRRRQTSQTPLNWHHKPTFDPEAFEPIGHR
jgi:hypothetical protein